MGYSIIRQNDNSNSSMMMEYMIDSISDVSSLPTDVAPGSLAATADLNYIYRLDNSGTWVRVGE